MNESSSNKVNNDNNSSGKWIKKSKIKCLYTHRKSSLDQPETLDKKI